MISGESAIIWSMLLFHTAQPVENYPACLLFTFFV